MDWSRWSAKKEGLGSTHNVFREDDVALKESTEDVSRKEDDLAESVSSRVERRREVERGRDEVSGPEEEGDEGRVAVGGACLVDVGSRYHSFRRIREHIVVHVRKTQLPIWPSSRVLP